MTFAGFPWLLRFGAGVTVDASGEGLVLRSPWCEIRLSAPPPGIPAVIERLAGSGGTEESLLSTYAATGGSGVPTAFFVVLGRLDQMGMITRSIERGGAPWLTTRPLRAPRGPAGTMPAPGSRHLLSRFASIRVDGAEVVLESPAAWAVATIHERSLMPLLHDLGAPVPWEELARRTPALPREILGAALGLLHHAGLVCRTEGDEAPAEDRSQGAAMWAIHDLALHGRTRGGDGRGPLGRTYPFRGRFEPLPAVAAPSGRDRQSLFRPDLQRLLERDPPFAAVCEARRLVRRFGVAAMTADQLGELLFRTLRVRGVTPLDPERGYGVTDRPHASAGATYPLEAYLAVERCLGVEAGLHRYLPDEHALERICERTPGVERLLEGARGASGAEARPDVLLILAARFGRVAWGYGALSYSLILKEVGVVFHAIQLACTAMGLGSCPLGYGDARLFAEVAGTDPLEEGSVGEVLIGSLPDAPA